MNTTITKEVISELTDLVFSMVDSTDTFDMAVIECLTEDFLQDNDLKFKDYTDFLIEVDGNEEAKYWMNFEDTKHYFFDVLNGFAITKSRVKCIVEMCVTSI